MYKTLDNNFSQLFGADQKPHQHQNNGGSKVSLERSASTVSDCYSNDGDINNHSYIEDLFHTSHKLLANTKANNILCSPIKTHSDLLLKPKLQLDLEEDRTLENYFENNSADYYMKENCNSLISRYIESNRNASSNYKPSSDIRQYEEALSKITESSSPAFLLENLSREVGCTEEPTRQSASSLQAGSTKSKDIAELLNPTLRLPDMSTRSGSSNSESRSHKADIEPPRPRLVRLTNSTSLHTVTSEALLPTERSADDEMVIKSVSIGSVLQHSSPQLTIKPGVHASIAKHLTSSGDSKLKYDSPRSARGSATAIKTVTSASSSAINLSEHTTQTCNNWIFKEVCVGTCDLITPLPLRLESGPSGLGDIASCAPTPLYRPDSPVTPSRLCLESELCECLTTLSRHVSLICDTMQSQSPSQSLLQGLSCSPIYSEVLIRRMHEQLRPLWQRLDCHVRRARSRTKGGSIRTRHRHRSADMATSVTTLAAACGDGGAGLMPATLKFSQQSPPSPPLAQHTQKLMMIHPGVDRHDWNCRLFELSPYDDIIRSFQVQSDRRLKAVANKMRCQISVDGPIRTFDSTSTCWNVRNKVVYHCAVAGSGRDVVDKCIKCIQDTFPQACLSELHPASCDKLE